MMEASDDSIRLLLADGQPGEIAALRRELAAAPGQTLQIHSCTDAVEALRLLADEQWDAVVLDLAMGEEEALDLLRSIQETAGAPPVIAVAARYDRRVDLACMRAGAAEFLAKANLTPETIERTLRYTIKHARTARRLEEALHMRDHFLSVLAHDIRGPLGVLASGLELYTRRLRELPPEKVEKFLRQAEQQTRQIQVLTTQVLDWASSQAPDFRPYRTTFTFEECLESALQTLHPLAQGKSITIENQAAPEILLHADRNMCETILRNLISNAIKFSQRGSRIEVKAAHQAGDKFCISVSDQGIGMSETLRRNLLSGGAIEVRPGTGNERGTGLGLQLCLRFVELHGGNLQIESHVDRGTRVTVVLPLHCLASPEPPAGPFPTLT